MELLFLFTFTLLYIVITHRHFERGVFLLFLLLPTYLIRFHLGSLPLTFLEIMVISLVNIHFLKNTKSFFQFLQTFIRENKFFSTGIFLFLLGTTIGVFASVDIKKALGEWRAFYIEPILLFFVLTHFFKTFHFHEQKEKIQTFILFPLILCGTATTLLSIYQHFTGWLVPSSFWQNRATYRVTAWYGFPNAVGLFLAPLIPLSLSLFFETLHNRNKKTHRIIFIFSIIFIFTAPLALLFAKGSGPIIGAAAALAMLFLFYKKTRLPVIILGLFSLILVFTSSHLYTIKQELLARDYSGSLRRDIWSETISLLKDHPFIGAGIASYEERIAPYRHNHTIEIFHHPHNIFLTIWVNTGIIGLIGFMLLLTQFFIQRVKKLNPQNIFIMCSLVVILVMGLVDSPYIKNDLAILFWTILFLGNHVSGQKQNLYP